MTPSTPPSLREQQLHYLFQKKLAQFGLAVDRMETDKLAEVFAEDIVGIYNGQLGHESLASFVAALQNQLGEGSNCGPKQHNIMNLQLLSFSETAALTRCNFYAVHQGLNRYAGQIWSTWGEYLDSWQFNGGDWRITRRDYTAYFDQGPAGINTRD